MSTFVDRLHSVLQGKRAKGIKYGKYPVYDVTKGDVKILEDLALKYGFPAEWLANLINFESGGTFNPAIQNSIGATGLIQFIKSTAIGLGTTTDALSKMTFAQQMQYVDKYIGGYLKSLGVKKGVFDPITQKVTDKFSQGDLFMFIFYPVSVGNPSYPFPEKVVKANGGIKTPMDYINKSISRAIFPLSEVPYSMAELKKKIVNVKDKAVQYGTKYPLRISFIGFFVGTMIAAVGTYLFINRKTIFK
jgi:hypothetical protein